MQRTPLVLAGITILTIASGCTALKPAPVFQDGAVVAGWAGSGPRETPLPISRTAGGPENSYAFNVYVIDAADLPRNRAALQGERPENRNLSACMTVDFRF